ncbi:amidase [Pseudooceanicola sp. CBS1P-1]|uniref:Amidase n=1 Tax=Pseudooceanicola albus TaxID=2692189 RepID=A0A6L7G003_9RHOB|nr:MULTISPECIES: amidase [Pseudooceanicola]MBT9383556.1 amidase [Pseudooceanicola endophyticus]MXN17411.1 amidase [Pseudooceanicola albus]
MTTYVTRLSLGDPAGPAIAVKDSIDIAGFPTRAGCPALEDAPPAPAHAEVVERLLAAGGHVLGKTTLHELAFGVSGINDHAGTAVNAQFPELIPGGSSSGSAAAVAEGSARIAIGTDTGGSVRIPAACCGVWGLKPSYGRLSRKGVMPAESSLDCVGPFAATLEDLEWAMAAMDPGFVARRIKTARVAYLSGQATPAIDAAVRAALRTPEIAVHEAELPAAAEAFEAGVSLINAENWAASGPLLETGKVHPAVAARIAAGADVDADEIARAEAVRARITAQIDALLGQAEVIALPTLADAPPTLELARRDPTAVAVTRNVRAFNLSGHPALAMPLAPLNGAPVSLQLVGARGADALVCAVAALIRG